MPEWFEAFFDGLYGRVLAGSFDEVKSREQAAMIRAVLNLRKGQRVLDIPCGMGRITLPLARAGLRMTGVDITKSYVRRAAALAKKKRLNARFVAEDMRRIDFDGEFDAAVNWFTSIGYFSDKDELEFCRRVFRALKCGGRFLVEAINKTWVDAHFSRNHPEQTVGGVRIGQQVLRRARDGRVRVLWTFRRGNRAERRVLVVRHYDGPALRKLLRAAGFRDVRFFGRPPLGRLTRHSRRLIAVAVKPKGPASAS
jgi:ubiquinone/menaquinone biosynthesis C-methylase UbiE